MTQVQVVHISGTIIDEAPSILALHPSPFALGPDHYLADGRGRRICPHCSNPVGMDGVCKGNACAVNNCSPAALADCARLGWR